jgi:hypothetical protein
VVGAAVKEHCSEDDYQQMGEHIAKKALILGSKAVSVGWLQL